MVKKSLCIIYVRISRDEDKEITTLDNQFNYCMDFCKKHNLQPIQELPIEVRGKKILTNYRLEEIDVSGDIDIDLRPKWKPLYLYLKKTYDVNTSENQIPYIITTKMNRFGRESYDFSYKLLKRIGVTVLHVFDDIKDEIQFEAKKFINKIPTIDGRKDATRGHRKQILSGYNISRPPWGYQVTKKFHKGRQVTKSFEKIKKTEPIVKDIFLLGAEGLNSYEIARQVNISHKDLIKKLGNICNNNIDNRKVDRILEHPIYAGYFKIVLDGVNYYYKSKAGKFIDISTFIKVNPDFFKKYKPLPLDKIETIVDYRKNKRLIK